MNHKMLVRALLIAAMAVAVSGCYYAPPPPAYGYYGYPSYYGGGYYYGGPAVSFGYYGGGRDWDDHGWHGGWHH